MLHRKGSWHITPKEFSEIATKLRAAYPRQAIPDKPSYDLWYECLQDLDPKWLNKAVTDLIKANKYCPSIAEVREQYNQYDTRTEQEIYIEKEHLQR
jgi:hypothetical protein